MSNVSSETLVMGIARTVSDLAMPERYLHSLEVLALTAAEIILRSVWMSVGRLRG